MIEILPESEGAVLGVQASGKLTDADYQETWIPKLEEIITAHGKVKALIYFDDSFQGWETAALMDDAKFGTKHRRDFEKIAVVGGPEWVRWSVKLFAHFMKGEVQTFNPDQLAAAWRWVKAS